MKNYFISVQSNLAYFSAVDAAFNNVFKAASWGLQRNVFISAVTFS
jgi:hypothetical protein